MTGLSGSAVLSETGLGKRKDALYSCRSQTTRAFWSVNYLVRASVVLHGSWGRDTTERVIRCRGACCGCKVPHGGTTTCGNEWITAVCGDLDQTRSGGGAVSNREALASTSDIRRVSGSRTSPCLDTRAHVPMQRSRISALRENRYLFHCPAAGLTEKAGPDPRSCSKSGRLAGIGFPSLNFKTTLWRSQGLLLPSSQVGTTTFADDLGPNLFRAFTRSPSILRPMYCAYFTSR